MAMSKNIFEEQVKEISKAGKKSDNDFAAVQDALKKVSIEYSGTTLEYLLSSRDISLAKDFIKAMRKNDFPMAVYYVISLQYVFNHSRWFDIRKRLEIANIGDRILQHELKEALHMRIYRMGFGLL